MKCPNCEEEIPLGTRYCENCGIRISSLEMLNSEIYSVQNLLSKPSYSDIKMLKWENKIYIIDVEKQIIYDEKNNIYGYYEILDNSFRSYIRVYDQQKNWILEIKPSIFSFKKKYRVKTNRGRTICKISKILLSSSFPRFFIETSTNEKMFIINTTISNIRIKSLITNSDVAVFGEMKNLDEIILNFERNDLSNFYFIRKIDLKVDPIIIIGGFMALMLYIRN